MNNIISPLISELLWKLEIIELHLDQHKLLTSGNRSPVYINCRKLISSPAGMDLVAATSVWVLDEMKVKYDCIAGGETAGIPFATWLSSRTARPMIYARKPTKGGNPRDAIEGKLNPGDHVLLFEDVITDGGSKLHFVESIRHKGGVLQTCLVVLDRQQGGKDLLQKVGVELISLTDFETCLKVGFSSGYLNQSQLSSLEEYQHDAARWHSQHGYEYTTPKQ